MNQTRLHQVLSTKARPGHLNPSIGAFACPLVYLGVPELRGLPGLAQFSLHADGMRDYYRLTAALALELSASPYNVAGYTVTQGSNYLMPVYFVPYFIAPPTIQRGSTNEAAQSLINLTELANLAAQ